MRKYIINVIIVALAIFALNAAEKIEAGPRGGRLLQTDTPRPEFFVEKDRKVSIVFYDANQKMVPAGGQIVTAIAEAKNARTTLEFEKKDDRLVSKGSLPQGEGYTVVVQYRANADARPKNFRIPLNLETCGGCKRAEYACTCHE